jgi:hypothetical protein
VDTYWKEQNHHLLSSNSWPFHFHRGECHQWRSKWLSAVLF